MPKAYLIASIRVHDQEGYDRFRAMSGAAIGSYGGKVLARDAAPEHREGDLRGIVILIEFESKEDARRFYESPEYSAAREVRALAAETDLMLIDGL